MDTRCVVVTHSGDGVDQKQMSVHKSYSMSVMAQDKKNLFVLEISRRGPLMIFFSNNL